MPITRKALLFAAALSTLAFACSHGSSDDSEGSVAAAASAASDGLCTTYCKKEGECDADLDEQTCEKSVRTWSRR